MFILLLFCGFVFDKEMHPLHINTNLISFSSWILKVDNATNDTDEEVFVFLCMQNYNLCFGLYNCVTGVLLSAFPSRYPHTCVKETLTERQELIWYYRLEQRFNEETGRRLPWRYYFDVFTCFFSLLPSHLRYVEIILPWVCLYPMMNHMLLPWENCSLPPL